MNTLNDNEFANTMAKTHMAAKLDYHTTNGSDEALMLREAQANESVVFVSNGYITTPCLVVHREKRMTTSRFTLMKLPN